MNLTEHEHNNCGIVYLVGAGPGDPGLLTRAGANALAIADAVVYDRLVNPVLLKLAPQNAEFIDVGKLPSLHKYTQNEINSILVNLAKQGKKVCRLKGGDPFVFGRGGEEAAVLKENDIPFVIIPGVSSAIAVPAYAGIPVTDRRYAKSFAVVTGHNSESSQRVGEIPNADTVVYLMGMANLPHIIEQVIASGCTPSTPIAVIQEGTTPRQRVVTGTLATIVNMVENAGLHSPVIIIVGEVVRLRDSLAWYDQQPLFGMNILITRAIHQAESLADLLTAAGANPVVVPLIAIELLPTPDNLIPRLQQADWLFFTSSNGVDSLREHLNELKRDIRALGMAKIAAIGQKTAHSLQLLNLHVDFVPKHADAAAMAMEFPDPQQSRIAIISPFESDEKLAHLLHERGAQVDNIPVYHTVPAPRVELPAVATIDAVTFASPSAVRSFRALMPGDIGSLIIACLGSTTADAARDAGLPVHVVSTEMTMAALVDALKQYYSEGHTK